jgi:hypothetical protein
LQAERVVANEAAQGTKFVNPVDIRVRETSAIRSLFEADSERDAASREDLGDWSDSKGKWVAVACGGGRKVSDRVIVIVQTIGKAT